MTLISSEAAVLFGGNVTGACWIWNTGKLLSGEFDTSLSLWKHCSHHENKRVGHASVLEPVSKRLWILGGSSCWDMSEPYPTEIISMSFNSAAPLRLLAMESALSHFDPTHPVWEAHKIPQHLRTELEDRRSHMEEERRTGMKGQRYNKY